MSTSVLLSSSVGLDESKAFFALVAHATSLDIVLSTDPETSTSWQEGDVKPVSPDPCEASAAAPQDPSPSAAALARVESLVTKSALWPASLNLWKRFQTFDTGASPTSMITDEPDIEPRAAAQYRPGKGRDDAPTDGPNLETLKFRASIVRDGQHPFNSVSASPRLGEAVSSVNRRWSVDLKVR